MNTIRVKCDIENQGSTAPNFHQDGYNYSLHLWVNRYNVGGGVSIISKTKSDKDIKIKRMLNPDEYIFFNDQIYYHTATYIQVENTLLTEGFRDMIILDFKKSN